MSTTPKQALIHVTEKVSIPLTDENRTNVSLIIDELKELAVPIRIGAVQLKTLIAGTREECSGFIIQDLDDEDTTEVPTEDTSEPTSEPTTGTSAASTDKDLSELLDGADADLEKSGEATGEVAGGDVATGEVSGEVADEEAAAETEKTSNQDKVAAAKKALGVGANTNLTPSSSTTSTRKPRRNLADLIAKARAGKNKDMIKAVEDGGFNLINLDTKERWFYFVSKDLDDQSMKSKRFDISPRKNGDIGVSLYIDGKASGVKKVVKSADGIKVAIEWMKTDKDVLAKLG